MSEITTQPAERDWELVEQAWLDWRDANYRHYDSHANELFEKAWAAGLLDSEAGRANTAVAPGAEPEPRPLFIRQPGGERGRVNLLRFQHAVGGAGRITGPHRLDTQASYFVWQAVSEDDVEKVWFAIGAFLGPEKFRAFRKALVVPQVRAVLAESPRNQRRRNRKEKRAMKRAAASAAAGNSAGRSH